MGNEQIHSRFDEIDKKIDKLLERCRSLQMENQDLTLRINHLESDLEAKIQSEAQVSEQEAVIQSKIDGLLTKLDGFIQSE